MGEAELDISNRIIIIRSIICFYGDAASQQIAEQVAADIQNQWNEPKFYIAFKSSGYLVKFAITGILTPSLQPETVWYNTDPKLNYFRVEAFSSGHISFVDGLGSNTGYFKLDNIPNGSTTAAHEYGHSLGLDHPAQLDIRGKGQPGIMYPRGTICDPAFQYDPNAAPFGPGGTLNPFFRKVLPNDILQLRLNKLNFSKDNKAILGGFSSIYHEKHLPLV